MLTLAACTMMLLAISCKKKDKTVEPVNDPPVGTPVTISLMQPMTGIPGDVITITGSGFSTQKNKNIVKIGGKAATVSEALATQLKVVIPNHPADGKVEVTVNSSSGQGATMLTLELPEADFVSGPQSAGLPQSFLCVNGSRFSDEYEWYVDGKKESASENIAPWIYSPGIHEVKLIAKRFFQGVLHSDTIVHEFEVAMDPNLIAHYPFNNDAIDVAPHQHHGTMVHITPGTSRKTMVGDALKFDGVSSMVRLPENLIHSLGNTKAISLWFKSEMPIVVASPLFGYQNAAVGGSLPSAYCPGVLISSANKLYGKLGDADDINALMNGGLVTDEWHHLCITGNQNTQIMYLDGVVLRTYPGPDETSGIAKTINQIGAAWYGIMLPGSNVLNTWTYFKGEIDDVRLYKTVLDRDRVRALANE